ncbi:MAG: type II secretion system protein [Dehalococcoidales bacterium]|nr:type II secretion system protein [Dehalococcoidales bacterium]
MYSSEKGFTLIELLIVIAILGVLAAVVVPNIGRFIGEGDQEAMDAELKNVQAAVQELMIEEQITTLSIQGLSTANTTENRTNDMTVFPSTADSYSLYGSSSGNYLKSDTTSYFYYVDFRGTVYQEQEAYTP